MLENLDKLKEANEIAILFSSTFKSSVQTVHDDLREMYPEKMIYLVPSSDIICHGKCKKFESYILMGIECPLHKFPNAIQFKVQPSVEIINRVRDFKGCVFLDSIYTGIAVPEIANEAPYLIVTENQMILDYYCTKFEDIITVNDNLKVNSKVEHLMKESANGYKLKGKKMIGVVFTSKIFESIATSIVNTINKFSRAYKIFLKDISYERLISIDNLDCIVLVDCPVFQFNQKLHIPVITPFSVECAITEKWNDEYDRNGFHGEESKELVIHSHAAQLMERRWFKGVVYKNEEEDMEIHEGRRGIAMKYDHEENPGCS